MAAHRASYLVEVEVHGSLFFQDITKTIKRVSGRLPSAFLIRTGAMDCEPRVISVPETRRKKYRPL